MMSHVVMGCNHMEWGSITIAGVSHGITTWPCGHGWVRAAETCRTPLKVENEHEGYEHAVLIFLAGFHHFLTSGENIIKFLFNAISLSVEIVSSFN